MIVGKKNPYVFTIGFDKKNPEHLEVVEILNGDGEKGGPDCGSSSAVYGEEVC